MILMPQVEYVGISSVIETADEIQATGLNANLITHWTYESNWKYDAAQAFGDPKRPAELGCLNVYLMSRANPVTFEGLEAARILQAIMILPKVPWVRDLMMEKAKALPLEEFYLYLTAAVMASESAAEENAERIKFEKNHGDE
jgi:hypothetical protein